MNSTTYLKWVRIISYLIRCQRIGIITSLSPWFSNRETDSKCYHNQKEVKSECSQDIYMNASVHIWCWFLSPSVKSSQLLLTQQKITLPSVQFSHSVVSNSVIPWTAARQASRSLHKLMSITLVMPSNHHPLLSPSPPAFNLPQHQGLFQWVSSSHKVAKVLEFQFSISLSNEYSGLISFRMDWLDLLAVQRTLKSLLQHHSSKASILRHSAFFIV